jgi:hypothetical protein
MKPAKFITYQKFTSKELAADLTRLLTDNEVQYDLEDNSISFDVSFANNPLLGDYRVKLQAADFARADEILNKQGEFIIRNIPASYYLNSFKEEELVEILRKPDEWGKVDYLLSQKLLREKGINVSDGMIADFRASRVKELSQQESISPIWLFVTYVWALAGGFMAIFAGWHLMTLRKTIFTGQEIYVYTAQSQNHGLRIFFLSIISIVGWLTAGVVYC